MSVAAKTRGSTPVGYVSELDPVEATAVLYLRLWNEGTEQQAQIWNDLATGLDPKEGELALRAFEQICRLCAHHGRRPLMRHGLRCKCLGSDESCFANFIGVASSGDFEDAMLIATTIVRADVAPSLTSLAETFGLALKRMSLRGNRPSHDDQMHATVH
ncbi:hypothetical protein LZG00_11355 [Rhodobacteraceae bacterium LMO-12]|nr:hypothetical protein [Rhodobacteraceae bacterium LMO-JJ12]